MERFPSLSAYYAAQGSHPGWPADCATLTQDGDSFRLMVMADSNDILIERVAGGEVLLLGRVHDRDVVDALLGPVRAQRELDELPERMTVAEAVALFGGRPESAEGEQELIRDWQARLSASERILEDGRRRSYALVDASSLAAVPEEDLHRRDQVDFASVDWRRVCAMAEAYLGWGGDPLDGQAVYEQARAAGLDEDEIDWLESLFSDPIQPGGPIYGNGRHRAMAMLAQGVERVVVDTRSELPAARRKALLVQAGAPLQELTELDEPPRRAEPAPAEPALLEI